MRLRTLRFLLRRVLTVLPGLVGVTLVIFLLTRVLPADPAILVAGDQASKEDLARARAELGLDRSLPEQYLRYMVRLLQGDLGMSLSTGHPVAQDLAQRLPATLELTLASLALAVAVAVPMGVLAAVRRNTVWDHVSRVVSIAGVSLPVFWTGLLLILIFYYALGWFPPPMGRISSLVGGPDRITGFYTLDSLLARDGERLFLSLHALTLPALALALVAMAPLARITRAAMVETLGADCVRAARAAGLPRRTVLWTVAFRNGLIPILTTTGMVFSFLLGGNVLVEKVFAWPGVGSYAAEALVVNDFAPVQGFVLAMAILYALLNLVIDLLYGVIDPRAQTVHG
jgi:peptide/nickel transport system permease protein